MARIELRNATVRLVDGYSNSAAVNGAVSAAATAMTIDTLGSAGVIPVSTRFSVAGATGRYTITVSDANSEWTLSLEAATAGTFTITLNSETTSSLNYNDNAATILAALEALASVTAGDLTISGVGTDADPFVIKTTTAGAIGDQANTMTVDGSSLTAANSEVFTVVYVGGDTHDVTFTPAAPTGGFADNAVVTITGRTLEVKVGDGNITYTENREFNYDLDRGNLDTVRQGDEIPMDVTIDFTWEFLAAITGAVTPTIEDVLKFRGPAASWASSSADPCEPKAINIEIEHEQPCLNVDQEVITLNDFRWESLDHNVDDAAVSASGRCNVAEATVQRLAV